MALLFATHIVMACVMTARIFFCFHASRSIWYSKGYRRCSTHIENLIASFSLSRSLSITFFHTVFYFSLLFLSSAMRVCVFCAGVCRKQFWVLLFHGTESFYFYSLFHFFDLAMCLLCRSSSHDENDFKFVAFFSLNMFLFCSNP